MSLADTSPESVRETERLACLARLISPVVHRINNSLAVLRGACDLGLQQSFSPHLQRASEETVRVAETLALFSRCAKTHSSHAGPFDLAAAVRTARLLIDVLASTHAVEFRDRLGDGEPVLVRGDRARLEQILVWFAAEGLLGGAPARSPAPSRLRISTRRAGTRLVLTAARSCPAGESPPPSSPCLEAARELAAEEGVEVRAGVRRGAVTFLRLSFSSLQPGAGAGGAARPVRRILLVEADTPRRELVRTVLEESGFHVRVPARDEPSPEELPLEDVDLVLLDADQAAGRGEFLDALVLATARRGAGRLGLLGVFSRASAGPDLPRLPAPFRPGELLEFIEALVS